jgi:glycosyltransferase 2 family protein
MKKTIRYIQIAVGILILAALIYSFDADAFSGIRIHFWSVETLIILLLLFLSLVPRAIRWQLLMNDKSAGQSISLNNSFRFLLVGAALNIVMPAGSGDVAKSYFGYKWTGIKERMVSVSLYDKLIAIGSLAFLCGYAFMLKGQVIFITAGCISILPLCALGCYFIFHKKKIVLNVLAWMESKIKRISISDILHQMRFSVKVTTAALMLSVAGWFLDYCLLYYCFELLSSQVDFVNVLSNGPLLTLGRLFPFTINGLGSDEALMVYLFLKSNIFKEEIFAVAILYRIVIMFIPAFFGLYYLYVTKRWNPKTPELNGH